MSSSADYRVEEYKALRSEILRNMEASERNMLACITGNSVVLAFGVKDSQPLVLVLACLIPLYFWVQHTFYRQAIAKIAAYIAIFIERQDVHLMWENRLQSVDIEARRPGLLYSLKTLLLPYPVLLIVSVITSFALLRPSWVPLGSLIGGSILMALVILAFAKLADVQYVDLRSKWQAEFLRLREAEERATALEPQLRVVSEPPNTKPQADTSGAA